MRKPISALVISSVMVAGIALSAPAAEAAPGGCLKYGAAGAVAGHVAGHHGVKGFIAGCALGMYKRHQYNRQQRELQKQQAGQRT